MLTSRLDCETEFYDDVDYVRRPKVPTTLDDSVLASVDPDELD